MEDREYSLDRLTQVSKEKVCKTLELPNFIVSFQGIPVPFPFSHKGLFNVK
jgi:hypothetical protein